MANAVLDATRQKREKVAKKLDDLLSTPKEEARALTDDEAAKFDSLAEEVGKLDKQIRGLEKEEARAEKVAAAAAAAEKPVGQATVRSEPMTYEKFGENSYFRDLGTIAASIIEPVDPEPARQRLFRHAREVEVESRHDPDLARRLREARAIPESDKTDFEQRVNPNTTAGTGGEFVPPLWLVSQYVPFVRPGRVFANRVRNLPLPPGINIINLPKITTGAQAAIQGSQATPVQSVDIVTSTVSARVNTIAGQEDISLQLLEQSPLAMDNVVWDDLGRDYDQRLDIQVVAGSGINGQHKGVLSVTSATSNTSITNANAITVSSANFHDTSTSATQFRSIVNGKTQIETLRVAAATAIWVHPRRANSWEFTAFDTQARPLFVAYNPFNALGVEVPNVPEGYAGSLTGLPVFKDANMPTAANGTSGNVVVTTGGTQDPIVVVKEDDLYLWEGTLRVRALPEILSGTLQIRFQLYAYSAFMPDRFPPSISYLTGAGVAAPTF